MDGSPPLTPAQSELLLDTATVRWLPQLETFSRQLQLLATVAQANHHDRWLSDFLSTQSSQPATQELILAIKTNREGQLDEALKHAAAAARAFQHRNRAGYLRAQLEHLYSLRRESKARECLELSSNVSAEATRAGYKWIQTQALLEESSCTAMVSSFDAAWRIATTARASAEQAQYESLLLRAIAMQASLHTNEGRLEQAWQSSLTGLTLFYKYPVIPERAFQFVSELEFVAEQQSQWHLAGLLQAEAISQLHGLDRHDFEATARFHLAAVHEANGDFQDAKREIALGQSAFNQLPPGPAREFLEAESEVALGSVEARLGSPEAASSHLQAVTPILDNSQNFTVALAYFTAEAELRKRLGDAQGELNWLRRCVEVGKKGYASLHSAPDRWEWERSVGTAYRRLIEIEVSGPHDPEQALVDWETYQAASVGRFEYGPKTVDADILNVTRRLASSTAIVYAIFSDSVVAWTVNKTGVHEFRITATPANLMHLALLFHQQCANPNSDLQKVKDTGLRLYELLLAPLTQEFRLADKLFIESDGVLGDVPWSAVVQPNGTYLGTTFMLVNTPRLTRLKSDPHSTKRKSYLIAYPGAASLGGVVYPGLPNAKAESEELAHKYDSVYLVNQSVTPKALVRFLPAVSRFHFSGHATTRSSGGELVLHGNAGDEFFSASKISSLNLRSLQLAVLAACETSTAPDAPRNPNGLVGAFIQSGTHRVLASSWPVDSRSTSELLLRFYSASDSPHQRVSIDYAWQIALSKSARDEHPFYWSAFELFGAPN